MKKLRLLVLFWWFTSAVVAIAAAQVAPASSDTSSSAVPASLPAAVPVPQPNATGQNTILEYSPPPEQYAKAKAYSVAHYSHFFVG